MAAGTYASSSPSGAPNMPGSRLNAKIRNTLATSRRADAQRFACLDAFQPQQSQQVQPGHREQHEPGGQETLARDPVQLQNLIDVAERT